MINQNRIDSMGELEQCIASGQVSAAQIQAHHAAGELGKSVAVQMPRIVHPEPHTYYWTDKELEAIYAYAQAYAADPSMFSWQPMSTAPKTGEVFAIRYPLQGHVKQLIYWDKLHGNWLHYGVAVFPEHQKCEWSQILADYFTESSAPDAEVKHFRDTGIRAMQNFLDGRIAATQAKLWLWKNFVDGRPEYWAFDNAFPVHVDGGDPQTLGQPCGYALIKPSRPGRPELSDETVLNQIAATPLAVAAREQWESRTSDAHRLQYLINENVMVAELNGRFWLKYQDGAEGVLEYKSAYDAIDAAIARKKGPNEHT